MLGFGVVVGCCGEGARGGVDAVVVMRFGVVSRLLLSSVSRLTCLEEVAVGRPLLRKMLADNDLLGDLLAIGRRMDTSTTP